MPESAPADAHRLAARAEEIAELARALGASAAQVRLHRAQIARSERSSDGRCQRRRSFHELDVQLFREGRSTRRVSTDLSAEGVTGLLTEALAELVRLPQALFSQPATAPLLQLPRGPFDSLRLADAALAAPLLDRCSARLSALPQLPAAVEESSRALALSDGRQTAGFAYTEACVEARIGGKLSRRWASRHLDALPTLEAIATQLVEDEAVLAAPARPLPVSPCALVVAPGPASELIDALVRQPPAGDLPPRLSVIADPWLPGGLGSAPFTSEGQPTRPVPVIEGGRRRVTLRPGKAPAPGTLRIGLGGRPLARLLAETESGVLVTGWTGPSDSPIWRSPELGFIGFEIAGGRRGAPLTGRVAKPSIPALFGLLERVGSDPWRFAAAQCPSLVFDGVPLRA